MTTLVELIRCPRCLSECALLESVVACSNAECCYNEQGFPLTHGQPVLIDFERSIFNREAYLGHSGAVMKRDSVSVKARVYRFLSGRNPVAAEKCKHMLNLLKARTDKPVVLVVGGGTVASGAEALYRDAGVEVVGTDVYASSVTRVVADGHHLPFRSGAFDAVWVQAVLEHVVEPHLVVEEIYRVLRDGGLVYSDVPFMQQVHEGAYDFSRFTLTGHRWLFRKFEQIDAGVVAGSGVALLWSLRSFARALGLSYGSATALALLFVWLRFLERVTKRGLNADAASATFFYGSKSDKHLHPKDLVGYFSSNR